MKHIVLTAVAVFLVALFPATGYTVINDSAVVQEGETPAVQDAGTPSVNNEEIPTVQAAETSEEPSSEWPTWRVKFGAGFGSLSFPIFLDATTHNFSPTISFSDKGSASGYGPSLAFEYWPIFARKYGIGIIGNYVGGIIGGSSTATAISYGAESYAGFDSAALLFHINKIKRIGDYSKDMEIFGGTISGSADYAVSRIGYGVRFGRADETSFELMLNIDSVGNKKVNVVSIGYGKSPKFYVEFGNDYPVMVEPAYKYGGDSKEAKGTYYILTITWYFADIIGTLF